MSNDHHNVADAAAATAVDTNAMDVARHAESHTRPQQIVILVIVIVIVVVVVVVVVVVIVV